MESMCRQSFAAGSRAVQTIAFAEHENRFRDAHGEVGIALQAAAKKRIARVPRFGRYCNQYDAHANWVHWRIFKSRLQRFRNLFVIC